MSSEMVLYLVCANSLFPSYLTDIPPSGRIAKLLHLSNVIGHSASGVNVDHYAARYIQHTQQDNHAGTGQQLSDGQEPSEFIDSSALAKPVSI